MSATIDYTPAFLVLFREAFFGVPDGLDYTWFVQGREALLPSLDALTAEQASHSPREGVATIAAHAYHMLFALRNGNSHFDGPEPEGTWESSWAKQTASEQEWVELRSCIRSEYESLVRAIDKQATPVDEEFLNGTLAILPHMAFHLGAIRQLMKLTTE